VLFKPPLAGLMLVECLLWVGDSSPAGRLPPAAEVARYDESPEDWIFYCSSWTRWEKR